jgi:MFS family permease
MIKNHVPTIPMRGTWAIRVFLCFAFAYLLSYAFRAVNAVIAPELMADLNISHSELGLLSSAYFVGFAVMQIPLGIALDRYGARRTESFLLLFALCGASIFAYADSLWGLTLGRLFIGIGVSACLMASFTAYRRWFSVEQQSQLASGMLVFGTAGALLTTIPIQLALPIIGWRGSFWIMAILVAIAFIGIRFGIPKFDDHPHTQKVKEGEVSFGFKEIIFHPFFLRMLPIGIVNHGGFLALQTLWLGPWMIEVLGFNSIFTVVTFALKFVHARNTWCRI